MYFCTAGFETYAAYALLVAKALLRDGMVHVLLLFQWLNNETSHRDNKDEICSLSLQTCVQCVRVRACVRACVRVCACAK